MSKPALSHRVQGMKFMQRANEKKLLAEAENKVSNQEEEATPPQQEEVPSKLSQPAAADGSVQSRCKIVYEGFPTGPVLGRFSFNAGKPVSKSDASQLRPAGGKEPGALPSGAKRKPGAETEESQPDVTDADMAKAFQRGPSSASKQTASGVDTKRKKARA